MNDFGRRRRTLRAVGASVLAAAAVLGVVIATSAGKVADEAPEGWRWESYGKVELQVPDTWRYGSDPSQWCVGWSGGQQVPRVFRPGASTAVLCPELPPAGSRAPYVSFLGGEAGVRNLDHGWVRESRSIGGTVVTIFSDDAALRARIFGSAREITTADVNGCARSHPAATNPTIRPRSEGGLGSVGDVRSVSVCSYQLRSAGTPLFTGRTFTGTAASGLADAIRSAPAGSGPNDSACAAGDFGERVYVLVVHGSKHDQEVIVRYAGCWHNGTDDGHTERQLTSEVLNPIFAGSDRAGSLSMPVGKLLN
jgi:hypothetical protein